MLVDDISRIGGLLNECGPNSEKYSEEQVYIEGGPMHWHDGTLKGHIAGPFNTEEEAHAKVRSRRERHRLENAKFHGESGKPPVNERQYYGHPGFQYRIMPAKEYFTRYLFQIQNAVAQAVVNLHAPTDPTVITPSKEDV